MKTSRARGKSSGWAAFDLKQQQQHKLGLQPKIGEDPFPPLPSKLTFLNNHGNLPGKNTLSTRSFSSVILHSADFPAPVEDVDRNKLPQGCNCGGNKISVGNNHDAAYKKLKELHGWADNSLIEEVIAAVDCEIDKASTLLKQMGSNENIEDNEGTNNNSTCDYFRHAGRTDKSVFLGKTTDLAADIADLSSTLEDALKDNSKGSEDVDVSCGQSLSDDAAANMKLILGHLRSIPVEPEWEEDDIYLIHRKNAIRMMRLASQHSRSATNAFLRGDHLSAKQQSLKARKEWLAAERLNARAAKEILSLRNRKNDPWKLDLHGLHAAEAVQALQEHLQKVEAQLPINRPISPNRVPSKKGIGSSVLDSFGSMDVDNLDKQQAGFRQRPTQLEIITGVGNHSQGQAALPVAVRSFLTENRYRFDDTRPGVITVQPKIRHW